MQLGAGLLKFIGEIAQRLHVFLYSLQQNYRTYFQTSSLKYGYPKFLELEKYPPLSQPFLKKAHPIQQLCQYIATTTLQNKLPNFFTG